MLPVIITPRFRSISYLLVSTLGKMENLTREATLVLCNYTSHYWWMDWWELHFLVGFILISGKMHTKEFVVLNAIRLKLNMTCFILALHINTVLVLFPVALPEPLAGGCWLECWSLSYILAHRFSVRDESHRLGRSFILGGVPKDTSIIFQREPSQSYLFTRVFNIIKIPNQGLSYFLTLPHSAASPSQVSPSKVPSCVVHSKPLKDLYDIEQGGIISPPLKYRDAVI